MNAAKRSVDKSASLFRGAMKIGPDGNDLLRCRPYFLIDLDTAVYLSEVTRIVDFLKAERDASKLKPVTDIYISSHGWHRNLFKGVAVYNRLSSRLAILFRRGRLTEYVDLATYSPLHINLHWNSDVDPDDWVDLEGRKRRDDFLDHVVSEFEPIAGGKANKADLINLMEDVYQYVTTTAAPDINPLDDGLQLNSRMLFDRLKEFQIAATPEATDAEKVALIWTKYHEAEPLKPTQEQLEKPESYAAPTQRFLRAASFLLRVLIPVVGLGALLDPFKSLFNLPFFVAIAKQSPLQKTEEFLACYTILYFVSLAVLMIARNRTLRARIAVKRTQFDASKPSKVPRPLNAPGIIAWAVMQAAHIVPVLAYCVVTYPSLFGLAACWIVVIALGVWFQLPMAVPVAIVAVWAFLCWTQLYATNVSFDERAGKRGTKPDEKWLKRAQSGLRVKFTSDFAAFPSELAHEADVPYSRAFGLWDTVRSQLAIVRMQMRAVSRSSKASEMVCELLSQARSEQNLLQPNVRIHLFGHSFGGLLVVNLAKHLAYEDEPIPVQTLCTIQGAYASDWFVGEDQTLENIRGWTAAIFTQYDTATGALYSLANAGRDGCGCIGLASTRNSPLGNKKAATVNTYFPLPSASLSLPPDLVQRLALVKSYLPKRTENSHCPVLNIDCSRFMSEGAVATGGAHDDIFKSDTIHTLWSIAHQQHWIDTHPTSS